MASKHIPNFENLPETVAGQGCVKAVKNSPLPVKLKNEAFRFIKRNILQDCKRVPPNCLKAHLIKTAGKLNFPEEKISRIKSLFKAKIGYHGYYLDNRKLCHV